jgi:hypothetical protein
MARDPRRGGNADAYGVGFGKPPEHSRFRKGRSGNPAGRPKGALDLGALLEKALAEKVVVKDAAGRRRAISKGEAAAIQLANKAAGGADPRATKLVIDLLAKRAVREGGATGPVPAEPGGDGSAPRPLPPIDWAGMTTAELVAVKEAIGIVRRHELGTGARAAAAGPPMPPTGPGGGEPDASEAILRYYTPSPGWPPDGGEEGG